MKKIVSVFLSILVVLHMSVPCLADDDFDASMYETGITYEQMERNPDKYIGQNVMFSGIVLQVLESDDENQGILALDEFYQDFLYFGYDPSILDFRLLEDDYVTLYGYSVGLFSYEAISGENITLPCMWVDKIEFYSEDETSTTFSVDGDSVDTFFNEDEVISQLEIEEEHLKDSWHNYDFLIVRNTSEFNLDLKVDVTYYDSEDKIIGVSSERELAVESGYPIVFRFRPDEEYSRAEYTFSAEQEERYEPVISDLSYEESVTDSKVILSVTNNGDEPADFVEGTVLFYKGDNLVGYDCMYFTDDDSELKPGKTIIKEFNCYDSFDSYEVYFTGRR